MNCSKKSVLLALFALSFAFLASAQSACRVSFEQSITSSWNNGGTVYTLVDAVIKNSGSADVKSIAINIANSDKLDNYWEIEKNNGVFGLPQWRNVVGLKVGEEHRFGYIIKSSDVAAITTTPSCDGSSSNPTNPPTTRPTNPPTTRPTDAPTSAPTTRPTTAPTTRPTNPPTSAPTTRPTSAPTTRPTNPPTSAPTTRPTSAPTTRPTTAPTERPTNAPTNPPTTRPTSAPTNPPTTRPTSAPTNPPTTRPTSAPTNPPTTRPTSAPTNPPAPGGRICPAGSVWSPTPGTTWQWQLTGTIDQTFNVQMYDIDLFDVSANVITQLHNSGRVVICYFSTQYEDWRPDASKFVSSILGSNLDDWPGERYVDIRSSVLRTIMTERLDLAVSKGCDGVEPDNVDSYANSNGLGLKAADQLDFNKFLAQQAHNRGLSIGLKNDLDQVNGLVSYFDWALNEQCNEYGECSMLRPFVTANKAVFGVEYTGSAGSVCPSMVSSRFSWLMKDLNLGARATQCCTYATGGCAQAAYTCVDYRSRRALYEDEAVATEEVVEAEVREEESAVVELENVENNNVVEEVNQVEEVSSHSGASTVAASVFVVAAAIALVL